MKPDDVWVVDSTPVECARSRETVKRSDLAGWTEYGYCASHSRYFWGLRRRTVAGVCARIAQRMLAFTAAIWHNDTIGANIRRSLTAYDH